MLALVLVALIASPGLASAANGDNITATESVSFTKRVADIGSCGVFNSATIDWGDGTSSAGQFDTGTTPGVKGTHTYAEEGTFPGSVTYTTDCVSNDKVTFTATVADAALTASGHDISATAGRSVTGVVSHFADADPNGTASDYSAQINWGDGTYTAGSVLAASAGGFDITGTHSYRSAGHATVKVTIADAGGSVTHSASTATIAARRPKISSLRLASHKFRAKNGTTLFLTLSEPGRVKAVITQRIRGRRVSGHCRTNAKRGKPCTLLRTVRTLSYHGAKGPNQFRLYTKGLGPGHYTVILKEVSKGKASAPVKAGYDVKANKKA